VAACSQALLQALSQCSRTGTSSGNDAFLVTKDSGRLKLLFRGLDLLTVINFTYFTITGDIIPIWQRPRGPLASRLRDVKSEILRLATQLGIKDLDFTVKSQLITFPTQSVGLKRFFSYLPVDPSVLPGTDTVIQLEDGAIRVHSAIMCQRCPFFNGLFLGRAKGKWIEGRRAEGDIRIDFSHVKRWAFERVLRWVYTDSCENLFDDLIAEDLDNYLDKIIEVLGLANELMIEILARGCQILISKHSKILFLLSHCKANLDS
jgi:hypothetical protein